MKPALLPAVAFAVAALFVGPLPAAPPAPAPSSALDLARQLNQAFADVAEQVSPCVVVIKVAQTEDPELNLDEDEKNPFFDFFRRQLEEERRKQRKRAPQGETPLNGRGSGIIIRANGYILTNRHVIAGAERIRVRLKNGKEYDAEVRGSDSKADIAVIKIKDESIKDLPVAHLGDSSKTRVGEFAIAIGAPYDLDYSVTFGHISAKGRSVFTGDPSLDQDYLQTDANINPGNSGGPLVNIEGEVVGINTLIRGLHTGIGFAVPVNLAREIADQLVSTGKFTRARLGVSIRALNDFPEMIPLAGGAENGVVILEIPDPKGPAARSNLKPSDIIIAIDGHPIATAQDLKNEIRSKAIGKPVSLDIVRNGKKMQVKVEPEEWNDPEADTLSKKTDADSPDPDSVGFTLKTMTKALAEEFGVEQKKGLIVTDLEPDGIAAKSGFKAGDIITEINHHPVSTPEAFRDLLKGASLKKGVVINFISEGVSKFQVLKDDGQ